MNKELFRHVMCAETIRQEFTGHRVVVTDTVFDGDKLSVGRVVGILADGEHTHYEKRNNTVILDLTAQDGNG